MAVLGLIIILLLLALTVVMVMCVKLQCKRTFSPSRKTSLTDTSGRVCVCLKLRYAGQAFV